MNPFWWWTVTFSRLKRATAGLNRRSVVITTTRPQTIKLVVAVGIATRQPGQLTADVLRHGEKARMKLMPRVNAGPFSLKNHGSRIPRPRLVMNLLLKHDGGFCF